MKPLPTIRQLQYLSAIAQTLSFNKAADICLVTQSTLSAGIKDLEILLDAQLVERTKRKVMLTPLGREVLVRGRNILDIAVEISDITTRSDDPLSGPLRLGVIPTIGPYLLPRIIPLLTEEFPKLELTLQEGLSADLVDRLGRGQLDVLILAFPYDAPDWEYEILFKDPFLFAEPLDHSGPQKDKITLKEIESDPRRMLLLEDGHCLRDHALSACRLHNVDRGFSATSLAMITQMVASGFGCTLLPAMALEAGITNGIDINMRLITQAAPHRDIGLAWRRSASRRADYKILASLLKKHFS